MKFYIAGRYSRREELALNALELMYLGHKITAEWLKGEHVADGETPFEHPEIWEPFAEADIRDIRSCDCLVFFAEPQSPQPPRGSRHVEFGIALGLGKRIVVIGDRENIFHTCSSRGIFVYPTWADFIADVQGLNKPAWTEEPKFMNEVL